MEYALVLEGGGSRGAYQAGSLKAFYEAGYKFSCVVGTSIGSINGAMIAQDDFEKMYDLWKNIRFSYFLDIDDNKLDKFFKRNIDISLIRYLSKKFGTTFKNRGISTEKIRSVLEDIIDENKVRNSDINFGLVTYSLTDKKPVEKYIEDISSGKLIDYLIASSRLPIFKSEALIDDKYFIDGGIYNNCPINMIDLNKYKDIVIIRTNVKGKIKGLDKAIKAGAKVTIITPSEELPSIMNFSNISIRNTIELGYYDTVKVLENLDGIKSYLRPVNEKKIFKMLCNYKEKKVYEIAELLNIETDMNYLKLLFEFILPKLNLKVGYKHTKSYKESVIVLMEYVAMLENINLLKIYTFEELLEKLKIAIRLNNKNNFDKAVCKFVKAIEME